MRYETIKDVDMRLSQSIVRYKSRPVLVKQILSPEPELDIALQDLITNMTHKISANTDDPDFDISPAPLGNCNTVESCVYLARKPARNQNQGINPASLYCYGDGKLVQGFQLGLVYLGKSILGEFFSFPHCALETDKGKAFDRYFSLHTTKDPGIRRVKHILDNVGLYIKSENRVLLSPRFQDPKLKTRLEKYVPVY